MQRFRRYRGDRYEIAGIGSKDYCFIILNFREMKKLVLSLAVVFGLGMVSCGGNKAAEATDSDTAVVAEVAVEESVNAEGDTTVAVEVAVDSAAAPAEAAN